MTTENSPAPQPPMLRSRGFIDPAKVRAASFATMTVCIVISVGACIFSIWDFTGRDTLWRTISTCIVIAGGMMAFGVLNALYASKDPGCQAA